MGFRTVVMLNNDMTHQWGHDSELGLRIMAAMNHSSSTSRIDMANLRGYGRVVECVHADQQTLAMLDGYTSFRYIDSQPWMRGIDENVDTLRLLKSAANKLGYRLVKKPTF